MSKNATRLVLEHATDGAALREAFFAENAERVVEAGRHMAARLAVGAKILFCGNGGSAADAQHMAAELVNRFLMERPSLPGIALTTDTSVLTAIGNDYGYDQVFRKQVQALGQQGDVLVAISTSGASANVLGAVEAARDKGLTSIGLCGGEGGELARLCDYPLVVKSASTPLVQEVHGAIGHLLCRLVDYYLFEAVIELQPYLPDPGRSVGGN